jgi:hypothetical protein
MTDRPWESWLRGGPRGTGCGCEFGVRVVCTEHCGGHAIPGPWEVPAEMLAPAAVEVQENRTALPEQFNLDFAYDIPVRGPTTRRRIVTLTLSSVDGTTAAAIADAWAHVDRVRAPLLSEIERLRAEIAELKKRAHATPG